MEGKRTSEISPRLHPDLEVKDFVKIHSSFSSAQCFSPPLPLRFTSVSPLLEQVNPSGQTRSGEILPLHSELRLPFLRLPSSGAEPKVTQSLSLVMNRPIRIRANPVRGGMHGVTLIFVPEQIQRSGSELKD